MSCATACKATPLPADVDITNVKSGLMCLYQPNSEGDLKIDPKVCFDTEEIKITGQGQCVFDGKKRPCTWYGFEFAYNNKTNNQITMTCHFTSNKPKVLGNPEEVLTDDDTNYEIKLEPGKGHFSNPQYTLFRYTNSLETILNINRCEIDSREAFEARFNITLPAKL